MSDIYLEMEPNLVNCPFCNKEFDLNSAEGISIVGETGSNIAVEMEVFLEKCPHCGTEACYD